MAAKASKHTGLAAERIVCLTYPVLCASTRQGIVEGLGCGEKVRRTNRRGRPLRFWCVIASPGGVYRPERTKDKAAPGPCR